MLKYYLEYCGHAQSLTFSIYPHTWKRVTLSRTNRIYMLDNETVNADAVKYYRSLEPSVRLRRANRPDRTPAGTEPAPEAKPTPAEKPEQKKSASAGEIKKAEPKTEDPAKTELPPEIVDEVKVTESAKEPESDVTESECYINRELPIEEQQTAPAMSQADLCEYIDMHYTEEQIKEFAETLHINIRRLRSKDSIISRMVSEKFQELANLALRQ